MGKQPLPNPKDRSRERSRRQVAPPPPASLHSLMGHLADDEHDDLSLSGADGASLDVNADLQMAGGGGVVGAAALDAKVLVLNKLYMALRVVSARRAFAMLVSDLAEVIHVDNGHYLSYDFSGWAELAAYQQQYEADRHDWVRTVRLQVAVPRVIRLLGYDRLPAQAVKLNRRNLFARDRNQCQYCGKAFPTSELSIDHVLPRSLGGGDSWENLVCACIRCNARKGGRTPEQAKMMLKKRPAMPKRNPLIAVRLGQDRYASWKQFLDHAYWSVELG